MARIVGEAALHALEARRDLHAFRQKVFRGVLGWLGDGRMIFMTSTGESYRRFLRGDTAAGQAASRLPIAKLDTRTGGISPPCPIERTETQPFATRDTVMSPHAFKHYRCQPAYRAGCFPA